MNPQKLVASLELSQEYARLMKEKGRELPESLFYWARTWNEYHTGNAEVADFEVVQKLNKSQELWGDGFIPALTSGEIGELLPQEIEYEGLDVQLMHIPIGLTHNTVYASHHGDIWHIEMEAPTEADARLKMLNYLLANNLV